LIYDAIEELKSPKKTRTVGITVFVVDSWMFGERAKAELVLKCAIYSVLHRHSSR